MTPYLRIFLLLDSEEIVYLADFLCKPLVDFDMNFTANHIRHGVHLFYVKVCRKSPLLPRKINLLLITNIV